MAWRTHTMRRARNAPRAPRSLRAPRAGAERSSVAASRTKKARLLMVLTRRRWSRGSLARKQGDSVVGSNARVADGPKKTERKAPTNSATTRHEPLQRIGDGRYFRDGSAGGGVRWTEAAGRPPVMMLAGWGDTTARFGAPSASCAHGALAMNGRKLKQHSIANDREQRGDPTMAGLCEDSQSQRRRARAITLARRAPKRPRPAAVADATPRPRPKHGKKSHNIIITKLF